VRGRLGQRVREATRVPPKLLAQLALKGWGNPYDAHAAGQKCSSLANIRIERLRPPLAKILRDALVGLRRKLASALQYARRRSSSGASASNGGTARRCRRGARSSS